MDVRRNASRTFSRLCGAFPLVAAIVSSASPGVCAEPASRPVVRLSGGDFGAPNPFRHDNRQGGTGHTNLDGDAAR